MGVTASAYLLLLCAVGLMRVVELRISRHNRRVLAAKGAKSVSEPGFWRMVVFHVGVLVSAGAEVVFLKRPFVPPLALTTGFLLLFAVGLRWWVIRVMGEHWNVRIVAATDLRVVSEGPFRWIRHPNYVAVFIEMLALPLLHTAWLTAVAGAILHILVLRERIRVEEAVLLADPAYWAVMGSKPRFVPSLFRNPMTSSGRQLGPKG